MSAALSSVRIATFGWRSAVWIAGRGSRGVGGDDERVVPRQAEPRERERHRRRRGVHVEPLRPDHGAERPHDPEEPGIAGCEHAHAAGLVADRLQGLREPLAEHHAPLSRRRQRREHVSAADDDVGAVEQRLRAGRHAPAGHAEDHDPPAQVPARFRYRSGRPSGRWRWP